MASSLHLPCASPLFLKPKHDHFLFHSIPTKSKTTISCSSSSSNQNQSQENESTSGGVERRNVLLGLGGLYMSGIPGRVLADPIKPPEFKKCGVATNLNTGNLLTDVNCCPPITDKIIDYKLPRVTEMKIRPSAHRVSPEYILKYNTAIDRMKRLPKDDPRNFMQQANIHCAYCNGAYDQPNTNNLDLLIHNSWLFFPFHRWYLYFHERILAKLIDDPSFALPFWNWDNPKGMTIPPMFLEPKAAIYDDKRNQTNLKSVVDLSLSNSDNPLQTVTNNLTVVHNEMIRANKNAYDFMGLSYRQGSEKTPGPGALERGSHTSIHVWVGDPRQPSGEDMGNFYSAGRDPLFYCHHANVDRMWTLWQYFIPSEKVPDKRITDPDFLNAAFLFYDENAQLVRVAVKDCLDNRKMGYEFERIDLPWLDYRPPPQTSKARIVKPKTKALGPDVFPLKLQDKVVRIQINKPNKGKADELLVLENIMVDTTKFLKFDIFVNDEDDNPSELDKASYAGTYAQVPHKSRNKTDTLSFRLKLIDLYDDINIHEDDDAVVVTLMPRHKGPGVVIGGIKIIQAPPAPESS